MEKLTVRENEVYRLMVTGDTYKQIGMKLGISPRTVKEYVKHIKEKCNALNSVEMVYKIENQVYFN